MNVTYGYVKLYAWEIIIKGQLFSYSRRVGLLNVNFSLKDLDPSGQHSIGGVSSVSLPYPVPLVQL